jgi:hypothetical protein
MKVTSIRIDETMRLARGRRLLTLIALVVLMLATACSETGAPPKVSYPGVWIGYLNFNGTNIASATTMTITDDEDHCYIMATHYGSRPGWGEYMLRIEGDLTLQVDERVLGPITITRYRAGIDTVSVIGYMSGIFELRLRQVLGGWQSNEGQVFSASGTWGARKQD